MNKLKDPPTAIEKLINTVLEVFFLAVLVTAIIVCFVALKFMVEILLGHDLLDSLAKVLIIV